MAVNRRTRTILCGSAVNCVIAVLVVSFLLTIWSVVTSRDPRDFVMFPWLMWAALFFAAPFAIFTGLIGMTLLTRVRRQSPTVGRYLPEAGTTGALLGALYPALAAALRLSGFVHRGFFGLGVVAGAASGLVVGRLSIRRVLNALPNPTV